jgi:hypothetical protein
MTTRRWMIAAAVVALLISPIQLKRRRDSFLALARYHASQEVLCGDRGRDVKESIEGFDAWIRAGDKIARGNGASSILLDNTRLKSERASLIEAAANCKRATAFHAEMSRKYAYAARHPWLPLEPDPPSP